MTAGELKKRFPNASASFIAENADDYRVDSLLPDPKPKRNQATALGGAAKGKAGSLERITVHFIGYRVRLLDADNHAGGCKDLLDGLRHASLIPEDSPQHIRLITEQEKVGSRSQEKTIIRITYL